MTDHSLFIICDDLCFCLNIENLGPQMSNVLSSLDTVGAERALSILKPPFRLEFIHIRINEALFSTWQGVSSNDVTQSISHISPHQSPTTCYYPETPSFSPPVPRPGYTNTVYGIINGQPLELLLVFFFT
ncbi:unnamed protein product, partial [Allacma fusca]